MENSPGMNLYLYPQAALAGIFPGMQCFSIICLMHVHCGQVSGKEELLKLRPD